MPEHVDSIKTYSVVWITLLILTALTTRVAYIDLGAFSVVVALAIAVCKMLLVALFFMHVRHSTRLTRLVDSRITRRTGKIISTSQPARGSAALLLVLPVRRGRG